MAFNKRRGNLKLLLLLATLCILILTLRSTLHDENYSIGCETSQECLDLLKEKAKKFGEDSVGYLLLADEDKKAMLQEDEQIRSMYNSQQHQEQEVENEEINIISYDDLEYSRLTSMNRVKAGFVVLVRNSELYQLRSSMSYLEKRFNHRFNYPWIFLNEEPFTDEFKNLTASMTNAEVHYGLIPEEHWSYPDWVDQDYAAATRRQMQREKIVYGGSESYRHMCRYQSGFFMLHPLLDDLDYYW
jgi:hypothetical protein